MNRPGDAEILIAARSALLDALEALTDQRAALVLIGAQAIYLHTGAAPVALAEATKDTDLAVDPRALHDYPLLEEAMQRAGFYLNRTDPQPGSWLSARVDLMVPELLAGLGERRDTPGRLLDKDAHDVYRLLRATETVTLATALAELQGNELARSVTDEAIVYLERLFAAGPEALGAMMGLKYAYTPKFIARERFPAFPRSGAAGLRTCCRPARGRVAAVHVEADDVARASARSRRSTWDWRVSYRIGTAIRLVSGRMIVAAQQANEI
jgi:hypothetical protein